MADMPCAVCGEQFDESMLLFHAKGRICESCELELEERSSLSRGVWFTVVNGPITAATGTVMVCVPYVGPFLMLVLGAIALWRGTVAIQVAWMSREDDALGQGQRTALLISGIVTCIWAVGLVMGGGVGGVLTFWMGMTGRG